LVIAVVLAAMRSIHPMVDRVGMGETLHGIRAMAESEHRRWRHEAKRCEGREGDRNPEAQAGRERGQHDSLFRCPSGKPKAMGGEPQADRPQL
jgi:hypothetical protein